MVSFIDEKVNSRLLLLSKKTIIIEIDGKANSTLAAIILNKLKNENPEFLVIGVCLCFNDDPKEKLKLADQIGEQYCSVYWREDLQDTYEYFRSQISVFHNKQTEKADEKLKINIKYTYLSNLASLENAYIANTYDHDDDIFGVGVDGRHEHLKFFYSMSKEDIIKVLLKERGDIKLVQDSIKFTKQDKFYLFLNQVLFKDIKLSDLTISLNFTSGLSTTRELFMAYTYTKELIPQSVIDKVDEIRTLVLNNQPFIL